MGEKFSKGVSRSNFSRWYGWVTEKLGTHDTSYYPHSATEDAFKNRTARSIVYGHSHVYEMVPLDSIVTGNSILDQIYINSGTWRPYHQLSRLHPEHEAFVQYQLMTYLAFFKGDERAGRHFEIKCGVLGPPTKPSA